MRVGSNRRGLWLVPLGLAYLALSGCYLGLQVEDGQAGDGDGGDGDGDPIPDPETALDEAKENLPTYLDFHTTVVARTCSPDGGVCHNNKEYPDLRTPQAMLTSVGALCNLAQDEPLEMFNGCEKTGDEIIFEFGGNPDFTTELAWVELVDSDTVELGIRDPMPEPMSNPDGETIALYRTFEDDDTVELMHLYSQVHYEQGETVIRVEEVADLNDTRKAMLQMGLVPGDPNRDEIFGADDEPFLLIEPGAPDKSYLLGRILGTVPGTPMPLANEPLSSAEMIAITCWIEGLGEEGAVDVYAPIDYDNCEAADQFGNPNPDSGHSLSNDVQPILDQRCAGSACHDDDNPAMGLDLTPGNTRDSLLRYSEQDSETPRVNPGNPANSYLMTKLTGPGVVGLQMPRTESGDGDPLSDEELAIIEAWIIAGAPDD